MVKKSESRLRTLLPFLKFKWLNGKPNSWQKRKVLTSKKECNKGVTFFLFQFVQEDMGNKWLWLKFWLSPNGLPKPTQLCNFEKQQTQSLLFLPVYSGGGIEKGRINLEMAAVRRPNQGVSPQSDAPMRLSNESRGFLPTLRPENVPEPQSAAGDPRQSGSPRLAQGNQRPPPPGCSTFLGRRLLLRRGTLFLF